MQSKLVNKRRELNFVQRVFYSLFAILRAESSHLCWFVTIGCASVGLVVGMYAVVSRWLWPDGPRTMEYAAIAVVVAWLNYEANRHFTFQKQERSAGSMGRFATVAVIATALNTLLFWIGHELLHVLDFLVIIVNYGLIALFTFSSHRLFTFHAHPWRFFGKIVCRQ